MFLQHQGRKFRGILVGLTVGLPDNRTAAIPFKDLLPAGTMFGLGKPLDSMKKDTQNGLLVTEVIEGVPIHLGQTGRFGRIFLQTEAQEVKKNCR